MMKYRCELGGENLLMQFKGEPALRLGFIVNRVVCAGSEGEAKQQAIEVVRAELTENALNDPGDPIRIVVRQVWALDDDHPDAVRRYGFIFFPEETQDN